MNWAILITTVLGALATAFEPNARDLAAKNPEVVGIVAAVLAVFANLAKAVAGPNK